MINVQHFRQTDSSRCGPAVVKMLLNYYGIEATEDELCKRCDHSYELGCEDVGMIKAFQSYDLAVKVYNNCTLEDLEYWIQHHIPVIVDWFASGATIEDCANGHSSIVVDIDREYVYLLDPTDPKIYSIKRDDFLRVWFDWRRSPFITKWEEMILRQIIVPFPKRLAI